MCFVIVSLSTRTQRAHPKNLKLVNFMNVVLDVISILRSASNNVGGGTQNWVGCQHVFIELGNPSSRDTTLDFAEQQRALSSFYHTRAYFTEHNNILVSETNASQSGGV